MPRRWTQADERPGAQRRAHESAPESRSEPGLRRIVGVTLIAMGGVAVLLGSQAPFMALGFALVFGLFAVQAALRLPDSSPRRTKDDSRRRS